MSALGALLCRIVLLASCLLTGFGLSLLAARFPAAALLLLAVGFWQRSRQWRGSGSSHGTAHSASQIELYRSGLLSPRGLILGRSSLASPPTRSEALRALFSPWVPSSLACGLFLAAFFRRSWRGDSMIRIQNPVHLATFAPTGRGKGVSVLVPNLLSYPESCVVTDPKGELWRLTADHRRHNFRHHVLRLDPFRTAGHGSGVATLNPLDFISVEEPDFLDQCRDLANALVVRLGTEHEPHWNDSAEQVLTAFIAYVCACESNPDERNLQLVRDLVSSRDAYLKTLKVMQQVHGYGGVIKRLGNQLSWLVEKELGSVLTTVQRHTAFLDSPAVAACTRESSFDPRALRSGKMTLYLILPPERLVSLAPLMRMWVATVLRVLTRGLPSEHNPVLFLLDEAGHLGHIQTLEDAVTMLRGYGIRVWFFFQSLGQLRKAFGERADVFLDNIDTQHYFGINAYESAEAISKRIGDATLMLTSFNQTTSRSRPDGYSANGQQQANISTSSSLTYSETGRRLYKPEEVIGLPEDIALVFHRNLPVVPVQLLRYYDAPEFKRGRTGAARGVGIAAIRGMILSFAFGALVAIVALFLPVPVRVSPRGAQSFPPAPQPLLLSPESRVRFPRRMNIVPDGYPSPGLRRNAWPSADGFDGGFPWFPPDPQPFPMPPFEGEPYPW